MMNRDNSRSHKYSLDMINTEKTNEKKAFITYT